MNNRWEQFKKIGDPRNRLNWVTRQIDYVREFELEATDIPELVEIVELWGDEEFLSGQDEDAVDEDGDEDDFIIWAPVHAWRALAQLGAAEVVVPLLAMLDQLDESGDDWYLEEFPDVFGLVGPAAISALEAYLAEPNHQTFTYVCVAHGLRRIAARHPAARPEAVRCLMTKLESFAKNDLALNAFLVEDLEELKVIEAAEVIEKAYAAERVDETIVGTWSEIRKGLGASGLGLAPEKDKPTIGFLLGRDLPMPDIAKLEVNNAKEPKPVRKRKGKRKKRNFK